ncbi:MAG: DUF5675 family protein [Flavobacteriales bacterium]
MPECTETHQEYLDAIEAFEDWMGTLVPAPDPMPEFNIAPQVLFTQNQLCNCVDQYVARLGEVMLDGEVSADEINDWTIWSIAVQTSDGYWQVMCSPPLACEPDFPLPTPVINAPEGCACCEGLEANAVANANQAYAQQIADLTLSLGNNYNTDCMSALEQFTMEFQDPEFHYTLYYYDQAGNLVRTVPPEGVEPLDIGVVPLGGGTPSGQAIIAAIADDRENGTRTVFMDHRMHSDHLYNSLNNPIRLNMPDHDRMDIWETALPTGLPYDLRITGSHFQGNRGYLSGWRNGPSSRARGYVYATDNGGSAWQRLYGLVAADQSAVNFGTTGAVGYSVGASGSVLRTEDGGSTWDLMTELTNRNALFRDVGVAPSGLGLVVGHPPGQDTPLAYKLNADQTIAAPTLTSMGGYGFSALRGWLNGGVWWWYATVNNGDNGTVAFATEGAAFNGATNLITIGTRAAMNTGHATGTGATGFMAGESGALLRTMDTGVTWKYVPTSTKEDFLKIHFINDVLGLALMEGGVLRWTVDGGHHWTDVDASFQGLRDFHYTQLVGPAHEFFAVGDNGLVVRVLLNMTNAAAYVPSFVPPPGAVTSYRSVYAENVGGDVLLIIGRDNGTVLGTSHLYAVDPGWSSITLPSANAVKDLVVHAPNANNRHGLFLSENGRLYQCPFDLTVPGWGTIHQFTYSSATPYKAITLRPNGMAVVSKATGTATLGRLELVDMVTMTGSFLAQATVPQLTSQTPDIRGLFTLGGTSSAVMSVGTSNPASPGLHAGIYRSTITGTGPYTTTLVDGRLSLRGALRLNNYARDMNAACGDQGTIAAQHPGAGATQWYVSYTPELNDLNGIAAYNPGSNKIIAVGDGGKAFVMVPNQPGTYTPIVMPTTVDLLDVAVIGEQVTISGRNGTIFYCENFGSVPTFVPLTPVGGDINGLIVRNSEVFAVGANGLVHRLLGSMRVPVTEVFTPRLNDIHFGDANHGYVVGANQVARYTTNGGLSWSVGGTQIVSGALNTVAAPYPTKAYNAVFSDAPGHALAVGTSNLSASFDNSTWTLGTLPTTPTNISYNDVVRLASGAEVVAGSIGTTGYIGKRASGGAWALEASLPNAAMRTIWAWPADFGKEDVLIGGDNSSLRLRRYQSGSWLLSPNPPFTTTGITGINIRSLWFHDRVTGYAAGTGGKIFRTTSATTMDHTTVTWNTTPRNAADGLLSQTSQPDVTIATMGFADRHRGFLGGTYATTPPGFARTVRDETELYSQRMWYDQLGRLILSQNTKQFNANPRRYSYTLYDPLGRIKEAGELRDVNGTMPGIFGMNVRGMWKPEVIDYPTFLAWVDPNDERYEVVRTFYDEPFNDVSISAEFGAEGQENLRLRVAHVTYAEQIPDDRDVLTYDHASHYSYDIHGNVKRLVQEHMQLGADEGTPGNLGRFKRLEYQYDLISGNVKEVHYQDGERDQFHHRYTYDADNRIEMVETSRNDDIATMWRTDARYFYYPHGPLQRVVIGDLEVQGMDYAYTLQGWLKGINSDLLLREKDMGHDADLSDSDPLNDFIGRDVYGLSLGYYGETDYVALNETAPDQGPFAQLGPGPMATDLRQLYNGNIAHTVNSLAPFDGTEVKYSGVTGQIGRPLAMVYQYDQLNRLRRAQGYAGLLADNKWEGAADPVTMPHDVSTYDYDANGNITLAKRWNDVGAQVDNMEYYYHYEGGELQRNRLYHIEEPFNSGDDYPVSLLGPENDIAHINDPGPSYHSNYIYDELGNLVKDKINWIEEIKWTATGKVREVIRPDGSGKQRLSFAYDAGGHRSLKNLLDENGNLQARDHYVHDAKGNVMAIYHYDDATGSLFVQERPLYGCQRLGSDGYKVHMENLAPPYDDTDDPAGLLNYELNDHLGNVTTTVTDELMPVDEGQDSNTSNDYNQPVIVSAQGYEAFGSLLHGRSFSSSWYRYLFQGQEHDDEMNGSLGSSYAYEFRIHDPRVGRFLSLDPLAKKYPQWAPYAFSGNQVVASRELEGLEPDEDRMNVGVPQAGPGRFAQLGTANGAAFDPNYTLVINRTTETANSTISTYSIRGGNPHEHPEARNITGFILEPAGPSTARANQDRRIPEGSYNIREHDGAHQQNVPLLFNAQVPETRAILIHIGNFPADTEGCLLPGTGQGTDQVTNSGVAFNELNDFMRAVGYARFNIQVNGITPMAPAAPVVPAPAAPVAQQAPVQDTAAPMLLVPRRDAEGIQFLDSTGRPIVDTIR